MDKAKMGEDWKRQAREIDWTGMMALGGYRGSQPRKEQDRGGDTPTWSQRVSKELYCGGASSSNRRGLARAIAAWVVTGLFSIIEYFIAREFFKQDAVLFYIPVAGLLGILVGSVLAVSAIAAGGQDGSIGSKLGSAYFLFVLIIFLICGSL